MWWSLVVLVPALAAAIAIAAAGRDDEAVPEAPDVPSLPAYRVVYEIRETAGSEPLITTEVVLVRRPFDARVETWQGPPHERGGLLSVTITNRGHFWHRQQGGDVEMGTARQPATAHRDASFAVFTEAAAVGAVNRAGDTTVLGRRCTIFAHREPRPSPLQPPTAGDRVESCITETGIVLREHWTIEGRAALQREAVFVETSPALDDELFLVGRTPDPTRETETASGAPTGAAVDEGARTERWIAKPRLPGGFAVDRRATLFLAGGGGAPREGYLESFRRNLDVVVVEQGRTPRRDPPWSSSAGRLVRLQSGLDARVVHYADRVEVRVLTEEAAGDGAVRYVVVRAPSSAVAHAVATSVTEPDAPRAAPRSGDGD